MFKREVHTEALTCPECGAKLTQERDQYLCSEHGAFFRYGAQLLVRVPNSNGKSGEAPLPWETRARAV